MAGPFAQWPEEVGFTVHELSVVLGGLDDAVAQLRQGSSEWRSVRAAQLVIWRKLWPELADLYEGPDDPKANG